MRIGLYKDEYGDESKFKMYPCCEINIDSMTQGTHYSKDVGSNQTMQGVTVSVTRFVFTASGAQKIEKTTKNPNELLMASPGWTWDDVLSKRNFMGQKGKFVNINHGGTKPADWDRAVYWKYYLYTSDNNFEQYQNAGTMFNAGNVYYTCPDFESEPQKVFYAKNNYATCFLIGQFVGAAGNSGYGSGAIMGGLSAGAGLGSASSTGRRRLVAMKAPNATYQGYATGFTDYIMMVDLPLLKLNDWTLVLPNPVQTLDAKMYTQMAHIIYGGKEYIGWGSIRYGTGASQTNPDTPSEAAFMCVPIACFQNAIFPDPVPYYDNSRPTGNSDGSGGTGPGLPDGDSIDFTRVSGGLMPLGYGLHAYQVLPSDIGVLNDFLWGRSGNAFDPGGMWNKFQNYKFNPVAGICSLHHIPFELLCDVGTSVSVSMAGVTFDGVSTGGVSINGLPIDSSEHVGHCRFPSSDYFDIEPPYIGFEDFARTKVKVYLPFCGSVDLDPALCIGGGIAVDYQCDNINGNVCVQVKTKSAPNANGGQREFVAAVASGNAAYHIPVTGNDNGTGEIIGSLKQAALGALSGNLGAVTGAAVDLGFGLEKHTTSVSGSLAGNVGYLGSLDVIVEITYGDYFGIGQQYADTIGRPSYVQGAVKEFSGFCQFKAHTESIDGATDSEKQEIARLLEQGIIVNITE